MRPIDAESFKAQLIYFASHMQDNGHSTYADAVDKVISILDRRQTINAVPVVHYKDTNTTVLNVKSIEDWQGRIILDEGEESRSSAVYYTDSDNMVRVVRCKDCRYSEPMKKHGVYKFGESSLNCTQCRGDDGYGYAGISVVWPDDYCSDGALKDEEEATK